jgi:hypothetical protein
MNPENIPLVMLFAFSGFLAALGLLALHAMKHQQRDEEERRNHPST